MENFYKIKDAFISTLASTLGIDVTRISIVDVVPGNARRRRLLASSAVVNFEVVPSPIIEFNSAESITVLEDVGMVAVEVVRSVNVVGDCGVRFAVSRLSSDNAVAGTNFIATTGVIYFKSKEERKKILVSVLSAPEYQAADVQFTVSISEAENATLGEKQITTVIVGNIHMPAPVAPKQAASGSTSSGVKLEWSPATWPAAPSFVYNTTKNWEVECTADRGQFVPTIRVAASVLSQYVGGLATYTKLECRSRVEAVGWSSWSAWSTMHTLPQCGDGARQGAEPCDDGNLESGDGCSASCTVENGYACSIADGGDVCSNGCRNGTKEAWEACDDGNNAVGDGCDNKCDIEYGWQCSAVAHPTILNARVSECNVPCGDGIRLQGFEGCDDSNTADGDGCSAQCEVEENAACVEDASDKSTCQKCGNGILEGTEVCDDAAVSGACLACVDVKAGYICTGTACEAGPSRVSTPLLTMAQEESVQAKWAAADGYGLPVLRYEVHIHVNGSASSLLRTDVFVPSQLLSAYKYTLVNLTSSTAYFIRVRACSDVGCGELSISSDVVSTLAPVVSLDEIGSLVTAAATTAAEASNIVVEAESFKVETAPPPPAAPVETQVQVNETQVELLQAQVLAAAAAKQEAAAQLLSNAGDYAIGFSVASLQNLTVSESVGLVELDLQLVRKSDGSTNHAGATDPLTLTWQIFSEGDVVSAPSDVAAIQGAVTFSVGTVNTTLALVISDNNDLNAGKPPKRFLLRLTQVQGGASVLAPRASLWITILDNEAPPVVSVQAQSQSFNVTPGAVTQVLLSRANWRYGAVKVSFAIVAISAQLNADYSVSSYEAIVASGSTSGVINVTTMDAQRAQDVLLRVELLSATSECVSGDGSFLCAASISKARNSSTILIAGLGPFSSTPAPTTTPFFPTFTPPPGTVVENVTLTLEVAMNASNFDEPAQLAFRQAVASAAGAALERVRIAKITVTNTRRRLLAEALQIDIEIGTSSGTEANAMAAKLEPDAINTQLTIQGLPQASIVAAAVSTNNLRASFCPPGYVGADGDPCEECPADTYKTINGSVSPCTPCPGDKQSLPGSKAASACRCPAGFATTAQGACVMCPPGSYTSGLDDSGCRLAPIAQQEALIADYLIRESRKRPFCIPGTYLPGNALRGGGGVCGSVCAWFAVVLCVFAVCVR